MVMPSSPAATVALVIVALVIVVFIVCGVWEAFASDIHTIGEESIATPHPDGGFKLTITRSGDWMGSAQISTQISSGCGMDGLAEVGRCRSISKSLKSNPGPTQQLIRERRPLLLAACQ